MKLKDWVDRNRLLFEAGDLNFLLKSLFNQDRFYDSVKNYALSPDQEDYLEVLKKQYLRGLPIAYILGLEEFFGLKIILDRCVFIPRPETELLVEKALEIISRENSSYILDLCCGSSAVAIAIDKNADKPLNIFSSDISWEALKVARSNVALHKAKVCLLQSDLFSAFKQQSFDLIICNPPYVERKLIIGSLKYEPRIALDGGERGLDFIEKILDKAYNYLGKKGCLIMEVGYNHKEPVDKMVENLNVYDTIEWIKDYSGYDRAIVLRKR